MILLFAATLFLSAALLFVIEPMFGRMVLPLLGGSPAVWNTVMLFYQAGLLAGYGYAHTLSGRRGAGRWWIAHVALMGGALLLLPVRIPASASPPEGVPPALWLLGLMVVTIGGPFLLVSTTGPLVQRWFARTGHHRSSDPYFLYAASNVGSMLGLLSYPFLIEPHSTLTQQSRLWAFGYAALVAMVGACAFVAHRRSGAGIVSEESDELRGEPVANGTLGAQAIRPFAPLSARRRLRWILLAFIPSSLMLGVTTHLSIDIAAIPLLWVLPLSVYLLTFILAFGRTPMPSVGVSSRILVYAVLGVMVVKEAHATEPLPLVIGLHLLALFAVGMVCHGSLALDRPEVGRLTEFYLWLAVGGVLGGLFNSLLAPVLFHSVVEYPLVLVLACLVAPSWSSRKGSRIGRDGAPDDGQHAGSRSPPVGWGRDLVVIGVFAGSLLALLLVLRAAGYEWKKEAYVVFLSFLCLPLFAFRRRPGRFGLALGSVLLVTATGLGAEGPTLYAGRSFFGVHRVIADRDSLGTIHRLVHGTTVHGIQRVGDDGCRDPLGYYYRGGPAGQIFETFGGRPGMSIGVAGLGAGGLTAYARPGQRWTYYEIDPLVVHIATNPALFCYVDAAAERPTMRIGDARMTLARDSTRYDLLVLDAYTSDAIPVHLITREAFALYRRHLTDAGVLAVHLSNRFFNLEPVVARLAADAGLEMRIRRDARKQSEVDRGHFSSVWAVVASESRLAPIASDPRWKRLQHPDAGPLWTDDFSSLFSVLR
jgi:hypothetical protein